MNVGETRNLDWSLYKTKVANCVSNGALAAADTKYTVTNKDGSDAASWVKIDAKKGTLMATPESSDNALGVSKLTINASVDGKVLDTLAVTLTVKELNSAPVFD